jgi:hypothetical protein
MRTKQIAKALGRRGGRARAARLSPEQRRRIAQLGGHARRRSLEAARRVADNFAYLSDVLLLGGAPVVARVTKVGGPLPSIHRHGNR